MATYEQIIQAYHTFTITHPALSCTYNVIRHLEERFPEYKFQLYVSTKLQICAKHESEIIWFEIDNSNPYHLIYIEGVDSR